jgi:hypothetical protein
MQFTTGHVPSPHTLECTGDTTHSARSTVVGFCVEPQCWHPCVTCYVTKATPNVCLQVWHRWGCELCQCIWQYHLQSFLCVPWQAGPQLCKVHLGSHIARGVLLATSEVLQSSCKRQQQQQYHGSAGYAWCSLMSCVMLGAAAPESPSVTNSWQLHLGFRAALHLLHAFSTRHCMHRTCVLQQKFCLLLVLPCSVTDWARSGAAA